MSEENMQAQQEKERLIDLLFPSRKKDEKSLDNTVIKAVNYESSRDESLDSQLFPNKEKTICTGKSLSEAVLLLEHGGEHVVYRNCSILPMF